MTTYSVKLDVGQEGIESVWPNNKWIPLEEVYLTGRYRLWQDGTMQVECIYQRLRRVKTTKKLFGLFNIESKSYKMRSRKAWIDESAFRWVDEYECEAMKCDLVKRGSMNLYLDGLMSMNARP